MRVLLPQFVFKDIASAILLTSVAGLWVFSGINLFIDLRKNGLKSGSLNGQVLAEQRLASALPSVFPSAYPTVSPSAAVSVSPSAIVNSGPGSTPKTEYTEYVSSKSTYGLMGEVNSFRKENGRGSLSESESICDFAKERFSELQTNYSHDGFSEMKEKTGKRSGAENIARTSKNMGSHYVVYEMWAKSDGHRTNMLGDYLEGCGYYDGRYAVFILAK